KGGRTFIMSHDQTSLSQFFESVNKRMIQRYSESYEYFQIVLAGKIIELRYWNINEVLLIKQSLNGRILPEEKDRSADVIIWCYSDDIELYIPEQFRNKPLPKGAMTDIYQGKDTTGCIKVTRSTEMTGADYK